WKVSDITGACALVSIFLMGAFAVLAWMRLADQNAEGARSLAEPPETGLGKAVCNFAPRFPSLDHSFTIQSPKVSHRARHAS
ncbi:MAG: hypothetical protein WBL22_11100, partial [Candidatus Sulfotelmatobacter sp.]